LRIEILPFVFQDERKNQSSWDEERDMVCLPLQQHVHLRPNKSNNLKWQWPWKDWFA